MEKQTQINIWYVVIAIMGVIWLRDVWVTTRQVELIPYSEFQRHLKAGEIKDIVITGDTLTGTLKKPMADGHQLFVTTAVDPALVKELDPYDVKYQAVVQSTFLRDLMSWVVPAVAFFVIWMFNVHMRKIRVAPGTSTEDIAALTPGFTGADLANLVNEAALVATRREATDVTLDDFTTAVERIVAGLEKRNRILNAVERRTVAYHEMGHALVALLDGRRDDLERGAKLLLSKETLVDADLEAFAARAAA